MGSIFDQVLAVSLETLNYNLATLLKRNGYNVIYGDFRDIGVIDATLESMRLAWPENETSAAASSALLTFKLASGTLSNAEYPPTFNIVDLKGWQFTTRFNLVDILQRPGPGVPPPSAWTARLADPRHYDIEYLYADLTNVDWSHFEPELSFVPSGRSMDSWRSSGNDYRFRSLSSFLDTWCDACKKSNPVRNYFGAEIGISDRPAGQTQPRFVPNDLIYRMYRSPSLRRDVFLYCETTQGDRATEALVEVYNGSLTKFLASNDYASDYWGRCFLTRREAFVEKHLLPPLQRTCAAIDVSFKAAVVELKWMTKEYFVVWPLERSPENNTQLDFRSQDWSLKLATHMGMTLYRYDVIRNPNAGGESRTTRVRDVLTGQASSRMTVELWQTNPTQVKIVGKTTLNRKGKYFMQDTVLSAELNTEWDLTWVRFVNLSIGTGSASDTLNMQFQTDPQFKVSPEPRASLVKNMSTNDEIGPGKPRTIEWWGNTIGDNLDSAWRQVQRGGNDLLKYTLPGSGGITYALPQITNSYDVCIQANIKMTNADFPTLKVRTLKSRGSGDSIAPTLPATWSIDKGIPGGQRNKISIKFTNTSEKDLTLKGLRLQFQGEKKPNALFFEDNFESLVEAQAPQNANGAHIRISKPKSAPTSPGLRLDLTRPTSNTQFKWMASVTPADANTGFLPSLKSSEFYEFTITARTGIGRFFLVNAVAALGNGTFPAIDDLVNTSLKVSFV